MFIRSVATTIVWWCCAEMCGSPRTECARRKTLRICGANKQ